MAIDDGATVYVLTITHPGGTEAWVCTDKARAQALWAMWAEDHWSESGLSGDPPEDDDERIGAYYEKTGDTWTFTETKLNRD